MSICTLILALLVLQGLEKCFSWDIIVVDDNNQLQFYNNGTLTHTEEIPSAEYIYSITYDPVHYRVLFVDRHDAKYRISSFDLLTRNIQPLVTRTSTCFGVTYDPVTQLLFWKEGSSIYSYSLNPASSNKAVDGNLIVTVDHNCWDIAVDSCGGFIYWITTHEIERARFDGSEREVLILDTVNWRYSLAIDQQTQKMYWTEDIHSGDQVHIESADLNGKNKRTLYSTKKYSYASSLAVSNDFLYWHDRDNNANLQLSKNQKQLEAKIISITNRFDSSYQVIAANYTIKDQLKGSQNCETLKSLIPNDSEPDCVDVMLCVHGTKVSGESSCKCNQGYTGEKCDIFVCQNYCLQGNCSIRPEGQPICSCHAGYSGQRCEVNACHGYCLNGGVCSLNEEDSPVCQCKIDYEGERCGIPICKDYCFQGNCNISAEGQPICSCTEGYSGERCEFNACHDFCFNNGVCFLNEEEKPVCQCTADYEGKRCDIAITHTGICGDNMTQQLLKELRREVLQVIKEELQCTLRSEVREVQVIKEELQSTLRSEMTQVLVIKEDLQRTLRLYSDKNDEYEAKIQKCEKSMKEENHSNVLRKQDEFTSNTLTSNTFSETN